MFSGVEREAALTRLAIGREADLGQRLVDAVVELIDLEILRASLPVAISRPNSREMRTGCSICATVLILLVWSCVQMLSSMPQRTCRPIAIAIMLIGSTWRIDDSSFRSAPSGTRRMKFISV